MKCRTCGNDLQGNEYNCPFCGSCVDYTQAVEQAKAGREEGFTFLYENTYRNKLYIAMKYMKNEQDAMDVLQDAYIKAFARLDSLQDANAFPGWMSTIVAHTALNALQKKQAVLFSDLQNENDEGDVFEYNLEDENMSTQPEMACTVQETQDMVHELIDSLSDEQRVCVLMFHLEGYSIRDIATILGCSENTVKSRLNYGRKNIKAKAEELQKKGYKLYSYTPMCLLVYLLMAERGNMIVTHVFEQMAGLGGNVAAGIIHGGAMQMAGNVTGGAAQIAGGTAGQMTGGASQIAGGTAGQVAGGTAQTGAAGSAAGAVEGGKAVAATVGKTAFIKTVTGKIVIAVASVALVGGAVGAGFAYKYSQDKKKDQNATTEAASEANDDTVTTEVTAETEATTEENVQTAQTEAVAETGTEAVSDQDAADHVAALIDAIYVQERTDETDAQCAEAKAAWDALTDAQKELVEGENADPDYFGRDTGDASKDDPLNEDEIGENEILVVSFGTSFNDSRTEDIGGVEKAIAEAYPDWSVRRAFTAQIIINHVQARDDEKIDNVDQALDRAVANGVKNLVIQPTHLMHGAEYDELMEAVEKYRDQFVSVAVAEPLLGEVGTDATVINDDKEAVAKAITAEAVADAGYDSLDAAAEDGTAFVFMGHGTAHTAKVSYSQMASVMKDLNYANVFIGTVEGEPEETACEAVIAAVKEAGYTKVVLRPLMVVAGDHANNDMAGEDDDSWKSMFEADGSFESVTCQIAGLGRIDTIEQLYVSHTQDAIDSLGSVDTAAATTAGDLEDGTYSAVFDTDSSMFHVNEACDGRGTLTVKDGKMTIHVSLVSQSIVNLYPGTAEDAQKSGAKLLEPTKDTVTYSDGTSEEVYGFDIPVEALDQEFDLAIIGTKGVWYDHKVSVSDPVAE